MRNLVVVVGMLLHFEVVYAITYEPIRKIVNSDSDAAIRLELKRWCKRKANEAGYVQVAVLYQSLSSCLAEVCQLIFLALTLRGPQCSHPSPAVCLGQWSKQATGQVLHCGTAV